MDARLVVGIGNIYAAESLYQAGISPLRKANRISRERYRVLADAIRATLAAAIAAGGSTVRDYVHSDGTSIAMAVPVASSFRAPSTVVRASRVRAAPGRCAPSVRRADRLSTVPIVSVEPLSHVAD